MVSYRGGWTAKADSGRESVQNEGSAGEDKERISRVKKERE